MSCRAETRGCAVTQASGWVPEGVDITVPHAARIYDYALGGVHNFPVDRDFVERAQQAVTGARQLARANRAFLGRAVRWLADAGITQFLDIGSGIPTAGNVHEVAQAVNPLARVIYVDFDPVAVRQSRSLLAGNPLAGVIEANLRRPAEILAHPEVTGLIDFGEPVAVLTVAVLHFIPDSAGLGEIIATLGAALSPGSYLVLSHVGPDPTPEGKAEQDRLIKMYEQTPTPVTVRTAEQVTALIEPTFELVGPGLVAATDWYPDPAAPADRPEPTVLVAVAQKR